MSQTMVNLIVIKIRPIAGYIDLTSFTQIRPWVTDGFDIILSHSTVNTALQSQKAVSAHL